MSEMRKGRALVWFRNDLRLKDNPALAYALRHHESVLCAYIDESAESGDPAANRWWVRGALIDLDDQLFGRLFYRQGVARAMLGELIDRYQVDAVYWNRRYEPQAREQDTAIKAWLKDSGFRVASFMGNLLSEPWEVTKPDGGPYRVFTPYYKALLKYGLAEPQDEAPAIEEGGLLEPEKSAREALEALPLRDWMADFAESWQPTREAALATLEAFADGVMAGYPEQRNLPSVRGCSRLSPYLHFGQLSPREVVRRVARLEGAEAFVRELIWREFGHYVLFHWPDSLDQPMDRRFEAVPWRDDAEGLAAWKLGLTGIPMVDAGMRELWHTGYMHNRVRMVVASLLTKHLLIDWREGADWFEYTLLDADLANNRMGWQWCAGSGVDAAPYFRIFNPVSQGERFDPNGDYVRRWVPELSRLPDKWLHKPWEAPEAILAAAGVGLGRDYPRPLVDLKAGRERALKVWERIKEHG